MQEKVLLLDFGGQYAELIARRVREMNVYAEIRSYQKITAEEIRKEGYKGLLFSGGPNSVTDPASPHFDPAVLSLGIPVLGICYGHQLIAYMAGGSIATGTGTGEYGKIEVRTERSPLFEGIPETVTTWMSHMDSVREAPAGFRVIARSSGGIIAGLSDDSRKIYTLQFHPEVTHTDYGKAMLRNFLYGIAGCAGDWHVDNFITESVEKYRKMLEGKKALLALSGGVDSTVAAVLMNRAIGDRLTCVFVDHGLLRKNEGDTVEQTLKSKFDMNIIRVNAKDRFLNRLAGVTDPEQKRKIIGEEFIRVFEAEAEELGKINYLVQGTIYPDVIESGTGSAAVIKSHHNVGGLPKDIGFDGIIEPLRYLFKDEVRKVGSALGLPKEIVNRQPFPGPGLAIRIIGDVTEDKLRILREADAIFREEIDRAGLTDSPNQYFAVLTNTMSVGVRGDMRSYGYLLALRAVSTDDFMTADWSRIPFEVLEKASDRITNELKEVSRVVYDITSKPPATVEWE